MNWREQFKKFAVDKPNAEAVPGNKVFEEFLAKKTSVNVTLLKRNGSPDAAASAKRVARARVRKVTNTFRSRPRVPIPVKLLAFRLRRSPLLEAIDPLRRQKWKKAVDRAKSVDTREVVLKGLSFLDNPNAALVAVGQLVEAETSAFDVRVHFDDERCLDIAPYLVLAMIWRDLAPVMNGGRMTREIRRIVEAVQLRRRLAMGPFRFALADLLEMHAFPVHSRRPAGSSTSATRHLDPQARERVQDGLVRSINDWLDHPLLAMELTPDGRASIKNIVGEMLDNAERHSAPDSMDGDWTLAGFMARREKPKSCQEDGGDDVQRGDDEHFQCSIAFVSLGTSIADSLASSAAPVAAEVAQYVARHVGNRDAAVLRTVMAIQDGITRVAESSENGRGGTGFQDVFDLVSGLGTPHLPGCEPKVTIVSGHACLKLHGCYSIGRRADGDLYAPRQIWFNEDNEPASPPDAESAFRLDKPFPGTLVTMSFAFTPTKIDGENK